MRPERSEGESDCVEQHQNAILRGKNSAAAAVRLFAGPRWLRSAPAKFRPPAGFGRVGSTKKSGRAARSKYKAAGASLLRVPQFRNTRSRARAVCNSAATPSHSLPMRLRDKPKFRAGG